MAGIVAGLWLADFAGVLVAIVLFLLSSVLFVSKQNRALLLTLLLFFIVGYWSLQGWVAPNLPANHVSNFADGEFER
jgi:apolipoprotein N-acyltransferase